MRILQLLSQTHLTGSEAHAVTLARHHLVAGHEVFFVSDRLHLSTEAPFVSRPIHAAKGWRRWREALWLRRFLKENKIDVVHAHSRAASRIGWWATRGLSTALVSTVHGRQHFSLGKRWFDLYGERVLAVCEDIKTHLVKDFRMRSHRIQVLRNPIWIPEVHRTSSSNLRVLFVTRWTGPKGERALEFLSEVLPQLLAENLSLEFDIAGEPPTLDSAAARQLVLLKDRFGTRVRHLGFVPDLEKRFGDYELIIGAGRVAAAALAVGRPTFAFGEAQCCGFIQEGNLSEALSSNFGDLSLSGKDQPLPTDFCRQELLKFLKSPQVGEVSKSLQSRVRADFDSKVVSEDVIRVYQSARFLKHVRRPIPVLMYHKVLEKEIETPHRIFVTAERFEAHLRSLKKSGRETLWFQDLLDFREGRRPLSEFPRSPVLLTFDDGYANNLTIAQPLLKKYGFKAVIFLLADQSLRFNSWDEGAAPQIPLMTPNERQEIAAGGAFEIGSHGFRHRKLPEMSDAEALTELIESKRALEKEFSRHIHVFAFTYGAVDERSPVLARQAGYQYAVSTDSGGIFIEEAPHLIFRVNVFPEDGPRRLLKKTSWWYRWSYYWKRGR